MNRRNWLSSLLGLLVMPWISRIKAVEAAVETEERELASLIHFRMLADQDDGRAPAVILGKVGTAPVKVGETTEVSFEDGSFRHAYNGCQGIAEYDSKRGSWFVVQCELICRQVQWCGPCSDCETLIAHWNPEKEIWELQGERN